MKLPLALLGGATLAVSCLAGDILPDGTGIAWVDDVALKQLR
jgi:hypothetical protein